MTDTFFRGAKVRPGKVQFTPEEKLTFSEALFVVAAIAVRDEHIDRERFLRMCGIGYDALTKALKEERNA